VILEALAHRVPVVSTNVCAIPEVIRNGETGFLVEEKRPDQLATAMEEMLRDRDRAIRMAEKGRELVLAEFDPDTNHGRIYDLFMKTGRLP